MTYYQSPGINFLVTQGRRRIFDRDLLLLDIRQPDVAEEHLGCKP